uniref:protein kinase C-binding protein 1-like n=1 Tax=Urocitellus parryii TaxID=9999 RepID=UPI000E55A237|nr:protein kinase C-binding protein 1-like [Urocitellus parryii]
MTMLTIEQLSYLLKFAIQKMKQPGTDAFQKPVPLEQHPDYAEYIFHPMDLCTLEKNAKKKMYGCTEAFLADAKWILHNCIIYNGGNHKLTQIAKVVIKICEHEAGLDLVGLRAVRLRVVGQDGNQSDEGRRSLPDPSVAVYVVPLEEPSS